MQLSPFLTLNCREKLISLEKPAVMGILNLTPDSFSDGGLYNSERAALRRVGEMLAEGVDIVDVGGYSSRPGAGDISEKDELKRISAIVSLILREFPEAVLSIDTFRSKVAKEMLELGVHMINDITAGKADENMLKTVAEYSVPYVMMHMKGTPQTMKNLAVYDNVTAAVWDYFVDRINAANQAGIKDIILDPGFGFAKTLNHNYEIFKNLSTFSRFRQPLLVGISRKSMIYKLVDTHANDIQDLTAALHLQALQQGARLLRVHDVKSAKRVIQLHLHLSHGAI